MQKLHSQRLLKPNSSIVIGNRHHNTESKRSIEDLNRKPLRRLLKERRLKEQLSQKAGPKKAEGVFLRDLVAGFTTHTNDDTLAPQPHGTNSSGVSSPERSSTYYLESALRSAPRSIQRKMSLGNSVEMLNATPAKMLDRESFSVNLRPNEANSIPMKPLDEKIANALTKKETKVFQATGKLP